MDHKQKLERMRHFGYPVASASGTMLVFDTPIGQPVRVELASFRALSVGRLLSALDKTAAHHRAQDREGRS